MSRDPIDHTCQSQGAIAEETLHCGGHLMLLPALTWETCRILYAVMLQNEFRELQ